MSSEGQKAWNGDDKSMLISATKGKTARRGRRRRNIQLACCPSAHCLRRDCELRRTRISFTSSVPSPSLLWGSISITEEKRRRKNREREREKLGLYSAVPWECVREWCGAPLIRQDQFTCFYNLWANTFNLFPQTIKWNREIKLHVHPRCHSILNRFDSSHCRRRFQGALNNFVPVMDKYGERPSRRTAGRRLMKDASSKLFSSVFSFPHPRAKSMKINPNSKKQSRCWDPARGTQLDKTV